MEMYNPISNKDRGVYFSFFKNMSYCLVGEKFDVLLRKITKIQGERWKNGGKGGIFTVLRGLRVYLKVPFPYISYNPYLHHKM